MPQKRPTLTPFRPSMLPTNGPDAESHPDSAPIPSGLPNIGKSTIGALNSEGFTNAWSVAHAELMQSVPEIPGVGPARWGVLEKWARSALTLEERKDLLTIHFERHRAAERGEPWRGEESAYPLKIVAVPPVSEDERAQLLAFCDDLRASDAPRLAELRAREAAKEASRDEERRAVERARSAAEEARLAERRAQDARDEARAPWFYLGTSALVGLIFAVVCGAPAGILLHGVDGKGVAHGLSVGLPVGGFSMIGCGIWLFLRQRRLTHHRCPHCGHTNKVGLSHGSATIRHQHETRSGSADGRYKHNPSTTDWTFSGLLCAKCGKSFDAFVSGG